MSTKFLYVTFMNDGWETKWFIICDDNGLPIIDIKEAKNHLHINYPNQYWGIADRSQMRLNNAMQDNI